MIFTRRKDTRVKDEGPIYLTANGLDNLKAKLSNLKNILPKLIDDVQKAAAYGDRSENAEYKEAKYNLRKTEGQILNIEDKLKRVVIINQDRKDGIVQIGSVVTIVNKKSGAKNKFQILGKLETNPEAGFISNESPLGRALAGKKIGEKFKLDLPNGTVAEYEVLKLD